jgi:hypothetical protein
MKKFADIAAALNKKCNGDSKKLFISLRQLYAMGCKEVNRDSKTRREKMERSMELLRTLLVSVGLEQELSEWDQPARGEPQAAMAGSQGR